MASQQLFHNIYYIAIIGMLLFSTYHVILNLRVDDQLRFFAFTVDTIYLHWNTSFPAVSICELFNGEKTWDLSEKYYGSNRNNKLDDFISDIAFFTGKCYSCSHCENDIACPTNVTEISTKFRSSCNDMISDCLWYSKPIDCCKAFLPLETEFGICFSINSIHTKPRYGHRLISNRITGPGILSFVTHEDVQVHVHAPNEVPDNIGSEIKENILYGSEKEIIVKVIDMVNDISVQDVSIENRNCRFSWERENLPHPSIYEQYSHSACTIECLMDIQMQFCNCTHHLMPKRKINARLCDIEGLICLTDNFGEINMLRRNCDCMSSCEESEYNTLYSSPNENFRDEPGSLITISMLDLPKERYIRHVVKTVLDDIISIGGIIGLFFGISILSALDNIIKTIKYLVKWFLWLFSKNGKKLKKGKNDTEISC